MVLDVGINLEKVLLEVSKPKIDPEFMDVWSEHPEKHFLQLQEGPVPLQKRVMLTSGDYSVRTAETLSDIDLSLQFVYTNYSQRDIPWIYPFNLNATIQSFKHREVPDEFQPYAHVLILEHQREPIGSVRVIPQGNPVGLPAVDHEDAYKRNEVERILEERIPGYYRLEASRLCVLEEYQKGPAMGHLMAGMYGLAKDYEASVGNTSFVFEADDKGIELYEKLGGVVTPFKALHPVGQELTLMTWKLEESRFASRWNRVLNSYKNVKTHAA